MNRRGTSLIEVLVAISLASVVLLVGGRTIHALLRNGGESGRLLAEGQSLTRLSRDFRHDVHVALTAAPHRPDDGVLCRLDLAGTWRVVYRLVEGQLVRLEERDGQRPRLESYIVSNGVWSMDATGEPPVLTLTCRSPRAVPRHRTSSKEAIQVTRIMAVIGRDHRFSTSKTQDAP